jgi:hypothetical protein
VRCFSRAGDGTGDKCSPIHDVPLRST